MSAYVRQATAAPPRRRSRSTGAIVATAVVLLATLVALLGAAVRPATSSAGTIAVVQCGDVYDQWGRGFRVGVFPWTDAGYGFIGGGNATSGAVLEPCNGTDHGYGTGMSAELTSRWSQTTGAGTYWQWVAPPDTTITTYGARFVWATRDFDGTSGTSGEVSVYNSTQNDPNYDFRQQRPGPRGSGVQSEETTIWRSPVGGASWVRFRAGCDGVSAGRTCPEGGASISHINVHGYTAHLRDDSNPQVSNVSGDLAASRYWRNAESISASITDRGTGIAQAIIQERQEDGTWTDKATQVVNSNGGTCIPLDSWSAGNTGISDPAYTSPRPCRTDASGDFEFDVSGLAEGTRLYRIQVADASGNRTSLVGQQERVIDRTAPTIDTDVIPRTCVAGSRTRVAAAAADAVSGVDVIKTTVTDGDASSHTLDTDGSIECPSVDVGPLTVSTDVTDKAGNRKTAGDVRVTVVPATPPTSSVPDVVFPEQPQATLSATHEVQITAGNTPFNTGRLRIEGADPDAFVIWREDCQSRQIAPGASCSVRLRFTPETKRAYAATLVVDSTTANAVLVVNLAGEGGDLPKGEDGQDGRDGVAGSDGKLGAPGAAAFGPAGKDGATGATGAAGTNGSDGNRGSDGNDGAKGSKGDRGAKGDRGRDGYRGVPGPRGAVGLRGAKGTKSPTAVYVCHRRRGSGRYERACFVRVTGAGKRKVDVLVTRGSRVVAVGSRRLRAGQHDVPVTARLAPRAGAYAIHVTVTDGAKRHIVTGHFSAAR
jgi:hypothetical protein